MTVKDIVKAYADELDNWNYFSDSQKAFVDDKGYIIVCLRDYNWYITKEPIKSDMTAIKSLFEIDWIAEYADETNIEFSKFWREL